MYEDSFRQVSTNTQSFRENTCWLVVYKVWSLLCIQGITGSNMIRSIRTVILLVGIDRTSSSNEFHCILSTYHTLTVSYTLDWVYKLTDEPVLYFVSEM